MVLGAVVAGPAAAQQYGQLAELGVQLLFQRYSRAHETEADLLGTGYIAKTNFNPIGAERMLIALDRLDRHESSAIEKYFQSHPDPAKRVKDVRKKIAELAPTASHAEPNRDEYVRMADGVITGNSTERVVIKRGTIYDREHGLIVTAPAGWESTTGGGLLFAMQPKNERSNLAFIAQEIDVRELQGSDTQNAVRNRLQQMGLQYVGSRQATSRTGERFSIDAWQGQTQSGTVGVESTEFRHSDHVAVFLFIAPSLSRSVSPLGDVIQSAVIDAARARYLSAIP
jgi:predicted Zn-dependent protease